MIKLHIHTPFLLQLGTLYSCVCIEGSAALTGTAPLPAVLTSCRLKHWQVSWPVQGSSTRCSQLGIIRTHKHQPHPEQCHWQQRSTVSRLLPCPGWTKEWVTYCTSTQVLLFPLQCFVWTSRKALAEARKTVTMLGLNGCVCERRTAHQHKQRHTCGSRRPTQRYTCTPI